MGVLQGVGKALLVLAVLWGVLAGAFFLARTVSRSMRKARTRSDDKAL